LFILVILTTDEICREYRANRSRKAAYFLMRLCASHYTERSVFSTASIITESLQSRLSMICNSHAMHSKLV